MAKERPRWLRGLLKGMLAFHICAIIGWTIPDAPKPVQNKTVPPAIMDWPLLINQSYLKPGLYRPWVITLGVWQSWDMFAPNPSNRDVWGSAIIEFEDGTKRDWEFPRVKNYNLFWKYEKERYRKSFERLNLPEYNRLLPDACLWIARVNNDNPSNPPTKVSLYMHLKEVPRIPAFSDYLSSVWSAARSGRLSMDVVSPRNPKNDGPYPTTLLYEYLIEKDQL